VPLGDDWSAAGLRGRLLRGEAPGLLEPMDRPAALREGGFRLHALR
jgi:hypothetical protein